MIKEIMAKERIMIRGIDRTDDYRILCEKCGKDFGGTVVARPGHKIHYIICQPCKHGTFANFLTEYNEKLNDLRNSK